MNSIKMLPDYMMKEMIATLKVVYSEQFTVYV